MKEYSERPRLFCRTPEKALYKGSVFVFGKRVTYPKDSDETLCIVILKGEQDFVFKSVSFQAGDKTLLLKSLNSAYAPYTVKVDDVLEIWKFVKYQSAAVPQSPASFDELMNHILEVKNMLLKK